MKPLPQITNTSRREPVGVVRPSARFPKTDCAYQARSFGRDYSGGGNERRRPSIRAISEEYFEGEARGHFVTEAAFFALIFVTSAVPVIEGMRGLVQFVYGVL
ncbi:MAG: hypothetical protein M3032_11400 [Verrucomicrobiota bacterium]|nr:hypothetical protein [Verrucomicrobiota bacterium]